MFCAIFHIMLMPICNGTSLSDVEPISTNVIRCAPTFPRPQQLSERSIVTCNMTWIKTIPPDQSDPLLRERMRAYKSLYPIEYRDEVESLKVVASRQTGGGISDSHSLLPDTLYHAFATLGTLLSPDLPLSRKQHEMIATVVSVINHCFY